MSVADTSDGIDTSIVIATCSRVDMLRNALASLEAAAVAFGAPVEFVVVDDGSTDETAAFLDEWSRTTPLPVRVLSGPRAGVAAARNVGSLAARGKWLASFDDDQIAQPGWLGALRSLADSTGAAVVGGALLLQLPEDVDADSLGPRVRKLLGQHLPWNEAHVYDTRVLPATNNVLIRSDVFAAMGGYNEAFTEGGEDKDFFDRVRAAGYESWFQPAARAWHVTPERRLTRENLRWTALRVGAGGARLDARERAWRTASKAAARLCVALLRDVPQLLLAKLAKRRNRQQDALCSLWFTQGYLRGLVAFKGRRGGHFLESLNFRARNGERSE